ncbi:MAG: hypothetical protein JST38_01070, partial [Bacteroidetes bacterium]|nr:hypothetical protein [Bacteroidota bacterium]
MRQFLREHYQILVFILLWVVVARLAGSLLWLVLPAGVFLLHRANRWQDILFGFLMCLIFSDMIRGLPGMDVMKSAKSMYILAMALIVVVEQRHLQPLARLFTIFLPFFVYAFFPIFFSPVPLLAIEKTISYGLLFLVVPNYVLHCFRLHGWDFFKNLIWFCVLVLVAQQFMRLGSPNQYLVSERFRG